ncbi:MAG: mechanosensitive ion channel family protein [Bacteroidota bacterium]
MDTLVNFIREVGLNPNVVFYELLVFFIGLLVLRIIRRSLKNVRNKGESFISRLRFFEAVRTKAPFKSVKKQREKALEGYAQRFSIIRKTIVVIYVVIWLLIMATPLFGNISATFVSIIAAILAAIIGIAARPFLENMIAGVVITFSRQFRVGDTVLIDDQYGTVEDITITHTVIKLWDWKRLVIPNSSMLSKEMVSYTTKDSYIWAHVEFWISYETDIFKVEEIALDAASRSLHFARTGVPRFWVMEMAREGIRCWVAAWTLTPADAWYLKIDVRKRLIQEFRKQGIKTHSYNLEGGKEHFFSQEHNEDG